MAFTGGKEGPDISETLLQYSVGVARAQLALFDLVAQACNNLSVTVHGIALTIGIVVEPPPSLGDQSVELQVNVTVPAAGVTISGDLVAVRYGGTVIVLTNVGIPLDTSLTQTVTSLAYGKVTALW